MPTSDGRPQTSRDRKLEVKQFWEEEACGERYGAAQDRRRYELEPEILHFADFSSAAGKRVLEVGVGMGADFVRWLRSGAQASGVDLTHRSVAITHERIAKEGLAGDVQVADAETLPFNDGQFDIVYSWGVLHHTSNTQQALSEARRVLAPGGQLKLMLYHRHSWVALAAWGRFGLLRGRPAMGLRRAVAHIESPGTKAFTATEAAAMLSGMEDVRVRPCLSHWDRRVAPGLARLLGDRFGWFLLIEARKPNP
jgi:ubiquinone/menaquinone biosynthesis C-methylase UbiE